MDLDRSNSAEDISSAHDGTGNQPQPNEAQTDSEACAHVEPPLEPIVFKMPDRNMPPPDPRRGLEPLGEYRTNRRQVFQMDYEAKDWVETAADEMLQRNTRTAKLMHDQIEEHKAMMRRRGLPPLWRHLCGIDAQQERNMPPGRRREALKRLVGAVSRFIRAEIEAHDAARDEFAERSYLWDPTRAICFHFEIARPALNNYCRELTGMSVTEIVDKIRAEKIRKSLREEVRGFMAEWRTCDGETGRRGYGERAEGRGDGETRGRVELGEADIPVCSDRAGRNACPTPARRGAPAEFGDLQNLPLREARWVVWKMFKRHRREQNFDRSEFAIRFEIPTHRRLFRACLLCYGKSPYQIEMEVIDEVLKAVYSESTPNDVAGTSEKQAGANSKYQNPNSKENDKQQTTRSEGEQHDGETT